VRLLAIESGTPLHTLPQSCQQSLSSLPQSPDFDLPVCRFLNRTREVRAAAPSGTEVVLISTERRRNRIPIREAAERARADGAAYFHRTNDDIEYLSTGWVTASVAALRKLDPPNVGVVGVKVYGDGAMNKLHGGMTIDVVHKTHLRIFKEYYPPQLENWYVDTWMVYVYVHTLGDRKRVVKLSRAQNFSARHAFQRRRYSPATSQLQLLPALTECGRYLVGTFINATRAGKTPHRPRTCHAEAGLTAQSVAQKSSRSHCFPRTSMVGGLEMNRRDFERGSQAVSAFCIDSKAV
jgi:hypothetical protein